MNGNSLIRSLAALSLPLLFFLSCNKTDQESHSASGITFVGVSSAEEQTKTSYSGEGTTSGGLLVKERLDWETGDYITIVSDSAFVINKSVTPWTLVYNQTGYSSCDYQITSAAPYGNSDPSKALISRAKVVPAGSGENGLQWGAGTHTFYAMYPASAGTPGFTNAERNKVGITPTEMRGTIPQAQSPKWTGNVGKPQMQYAYMWGTATAEANATSVNLPFYPQFSAFEFQVGLGQNEEVKITSFTFESTSASAAVTGDFTLLNASGRNGAVSTSNTSNKISVSLDKTLKPTQADSTITFTVLALPTSKGHMRMTFTGPEIGTRTVILKKNGTEISFNDPRKKYRITGIHFPKNGLGAGGEDILWDQEAFGEDIWWEDQYVLDGTLADASAPALGGDVTISNEFKSFFSYSSGDQEPAPFTFQWSADGTSNWTEGLPDWIEVDSSVTLEGSVDGQALKLRVKPQERVNENPHTAILRARTPNSNFDLSTKNVATGATVSRTTANCYVVDAPGTYRFPAVYGNGVKNGSPNQKAYEGLTSSTIWIDNNSTMSLTEVSDNPIHGYSSGTGIWLNRFFDHRDEAITSPYIAMQHSGKSFFARLLWTDAPNLVSNVYLSGSGEDMYVNFEVPASAICQGNASIAILVDGEIAWSWHIWVTDTDLRSFDFDGKKIMPDNVGTRTKYEVQYPERSAYVRLLGVDGVTMTEPARLSQTAATMQVTADALHFQWGRKDPITSTYYTVMSNNAPYARYKREIFGDGDSRVTFDDMTYGSSIRRPSLFEVDVIKGSYLDENIALSPVMMPRPRYLCCANSWNSNRQGDGYTVTTCKTIYDPSPSGYRVPSDRLSAMPTLTLNPAYREFSYTAGGRTIYFPTTGNIFTGENAGTIATNSGVLDDIWVLEPRSFVTSSGVVQNPFTATFNRLHKDKTKWEVRYSLLNSTASTDYVWTGKAVRPEAE